jgi:hypothetical protein
MENIQALMGQKPKETQDPLQKLNELEDKPNPKDPKKRDFDNDAILEILMTGENTGGMFTPNKEETDEEKEEDETLKADIGATTNISRKYQKALLEDMIKNPDKFKIDTPEGEMTVKEALERGYNPVTKQFGENKFKKKKEELLNRLNEDDRAKLERMTSPEAAGLAPADAEMMGLPSGMPTRPVPRAMPGGAPIEGQPEQPEETGGTNAIASLLGGGKM